MALPTVLSKGTIQGYFIDIAGDPVVGMSVVITASVDETTVPTATQPVSISLRKGYQAGPTDTNGFFSKQVISNEDNDLFDHAWRYRISFGNGLFADRYVSVAANTTVDLGVYRIGVTGGTTTGGGTTGGGTTTPTNQAPVAAFTSATNGTNLTVDASSSTDPEGSGLNYAFDFGDGSTSTAKAITHPYAAAGTYTVKLTVTDPQGAFNTLTKSITVTAASSMARLSRDVDTGAIVTADDTQVKMAGANIFQLIVNDYGSSPRLMTHTEIDALLDKCVAVGLDLIRVHTLGINVGPNPWNLVSGVSGTTSPTVAYRSPVWEVMDYAVYAAGKRGIYLMPPMTDQQSGRVTAGVYHGAMRDWVNFRRPGTCSESKDVTSASSPAERAAEGFFYTDTQIVADFRKYVSDWLNHINQYTGVAYKNDPTIAIVETGNEMWTAAQDAPTWTPGLAAYIKSIAPLVLVGDGAAADGQAIVAAHLNSPAIDIHGTHPYSTYGAADVTTMAAQAAAAGKAFLVGEYPWSKANAAAIEAAARNSPTIVATAFWSLQLDADLHNNGAAYGTDDVSLYYPGKDATQTAAVTRLRNHAGDMPTSTLVGSGSGGGGSTGGGTTGSVSVLNTLKLGVHNDADYPDSRVEAYYLQENAATIPAAVVTDIRSRLAKGYTVFITITSKTTKDMPDRVVAGNAAALSWMDTYLTSVKALADYATSLNNGSCVLYTMWHEAKPQTLLNGLTSTGSVFGQALQILGQRGSALITSRGFWGVWLAGSDTVFEGAQLAACTSPKPIWVSVDPYANQNGSQTLSSVATGDLRWVIAQPSYFAGQYLAITETGMSTTASKGITEAQLATFYTDWKSKLAAIKTAINAPICACIFFNSDTSGTSNTHVITQAAHPQAYAALTASMANQ